MNPLAEPLNYSHPKSKGKVSQIKPCPTEVNGKSIVE